MQYMLLIYDDENASGKQSEAEQGEVFGAYMAYTQALKDAGAFVAGDPLQPSSTATTVRLRSDTREVLDGPYADTKEQLGGYYLVEAKDLDEAVAWAARCPGATHGVMEVRPVMVIPGAA